MACNFKVDKRAVAYPNYIYKWNGHSFKILPRAT